MKRLGVYKGWKTGDDWASQLQADIPLRSEVADIDRKALGRYAAGEVPFESEEGPLNPALPPYFGRLGSCLSLVAAYTDEQAAIAMLRVRPWLSQWALSNSYLYWAQHISLRRKHISFSHSMGALTGCLCLGWHDQTQRLGRLILNAYIEKRFNPLRGDYVFPLYHWLLRIYVDFAQLPPPTYAEDALHEDVLNELYAHWKDPDLAGMQEHLLWLCDYYTHRTRPALETEFGNDTMFHRLPGVILAWFRMREELGLTNPQIDHPLMEPDYAKLPEPQPFPQDELLEAVIARLRREELPHLGEVPPVGFASKVRNTGLFSRIFRR